RPHVEEQSLPFHRSCATLVQTHLKRLRPDEARRAHDQIGTARPVLVQVHGDQPVDQVALALPHAPYVDRRRARHHPERRRVVDQVRHFGAPDLVLARKAVEVGARAPDVPAFHHGGPTPGPGQVPRQELAARSAAQDEVVVSIGAHLHSPSQRVGGDQVAEVRPVVAGHRPFQHVAVHRPECGRRLVAKPSENARTIPRLKSIRGYAERTASRSPAGISSSPSPRTSASTPPVTSAISGRLCHGISGVVCRAIASHTTPAVDSSMPLARRKSRAAFAESTSNRWSRLRYFAVSPRSWKTAPRYSSSR